MNWLLENVLYLPFLIGVIFTIAGGILYRYPPKNINYMYGYRTTASMKSQARWDFAQRYSALKMAQAGVLFFFLSFIGLILPNNDWIQLGVGLPLTMCSCIFMFFTTERALKKNFPND